MAQAMFQELNRVLEQVAKDKGIPKATLIEAIETAFLSAARKKWGHLGELESHFNEATGEIELFQFKTVVENIGDPNVEMNMEEAHKLDPEAAPGDSLGVKMDPSVFGRIAAQTAKQVIIQKIQEAERNIVYQEYKDRVGELMTGIIRRIEKGDMVIDLGRTEAVVPRSEIVPSESFKTGERIQAFFLEINPNRPVSMLILSRRHANLVRELFKMEVPEVASGLVEIKSVAREPGIRSKIGVASRDNDVDPVGACVGVKGSRVQSVVQELRGEKIDIVAWDADPAKFVCNAIAPAEVIKVIIKEREGTMEVVVPDDQLSLAIGKKGQNVRLAAGLTGWRIDIYSESKITDLTTKAKAILKRVLEVDDSTSLILYSHGLRSFEDIAAAELETLKKVPGVGEEKWQLLKEKANAAKDQGLTTQSLWVEMFPEPVTQAAPEPKEAPVGGA